MALQGYARRTGSIDTAAFPQGCSDAWLLEDGLMDMSLNGHIFLLAVPAIIQSPGKN